MSGIFFARFRLFFSFFVNCCSVVSCDFCVFIVKGSCPSAPSSYLPKHLLSFFLVGPLSALENMSLRTQISHAYIHPKYTLCILGCCVLPKHILSAFIFSTSTVTIIIQAYASSHLDSCNLTALFCIHSCHPSPVSPGVTKVTSQKCKSNNVTFLFRLSSGFSLHLE